MIIEGTTKSLEEKLYLNLEEAILSGEYKVGDPLRELTICKKYEVSRTPVRAALHRLAEDGLIEITPNKGAITLGVSEDDLIDTFSIRMRLEGLASRMAAQRISPEKLGELTEALELAEFYLSRGDTEKLKEIDTSFHLIIYQASGSRRLSRILAEMHKSIKAYRKLSLNIPGRLERSIEEHRMILEAIRRGDPDEADRLTSMHAQMAMENLMKMIKR